VSRDPSRQHSPGPWPWARSWLLLALILVAFARGTWALGDKSLWWDESLSLHRVKDSLGYVLSNEIILTDNVHSLLTIDNHPPVYFLVLWLATRFFGQSEFALRFPSLFFAVLLVPLLYATTRRLLDDRAGLAAAALGALSPMYLWYGQEARMYVMLAFLSLLSFYCFSRAFFCPLDQLTLYSQQQWIGAYVLVSALVVLTQYLGLLLIFFQLLALGILLLRQRDPSRLLLLSIATMLALALTAFAYALFTLPRATSRAGFRFVPLAELLRDLLNSFSLGLSVDVGDWYVVLVDLIFLLFLVLGFLRLVWPGASSRCRVAGYLLAGFLLVPTALIYLLSYVQPAYMNSRHLILVTPAFYMLLAWGLVSWRGRMGAVVLLGWLVVLGGVSYSTYHYFHNPAYDKDHHREWGAYLQEHVRPGDAVVVAPPHIAELYDYYAGSMEPWIGLPLLGLSAEESIAALESLFERYDRVWLALSHTPPWGDRHRLAETWLNENAFRTDYRAFESYASTVLVACYLRSWPSVQALPSGTQPVEARYNSALRLKGYRLVSEARPDRLLHVQLFWAVDQPGPDQASMLLRLVDEEGHLWGEGEQCPFNGLYPMWQWQQGLLLQDEHELTMQPGTPPGSYRLELVLYERAMEHGCLGVRGRALPALEAETHKGGGESLLLGSVEVGSPLTPIEPGDLGVERRRPVRLGALELVGQSVAPAELAPGQRLDVELYWRAREQPLSDAQVTLRLMNRAEGVHYDLVVRPAGDGHPIDQWLPGDLYKGKFSLRLPEEAPAGRYRLQLLTEAPLQRGGLLAALGRWLRRDEGSLTLAHIPVQSLSARQTAMPATEIPLPADLSISHPLLVTLGDRVRFLGYDLHTDSVQAGDTVSFTLYWQALQTMDISYTVFTHLLGASNEILGQRDGLPHGGAYPTTRWQPGEVIADHYTFSVKAATGPGRYPLEVGMYQLETGIRLQAVDASGQRLPDDRILLEKVTVLPAATATPAIRGELYRVHLPLVVMTR
jgi:uncharacterized membrane protein